MTMVLPSVIVQLLLFLRFGVSTHYLGFPPKSIRDSWNAHNPQGEEQLVYLPALISREAQSTIDRPSEDVPVSYNFNALGRNFDLELMPNRGLISSRFQVFVDGEAKSPLEHVDSSCYYQHVGMGAVAALSSCYGHSLQGLIMMDNSTYELHPAEQASSRSDRPESGMIAHVIRRVPTPPAPGDDDLLLRPKIRHIHRRRHQRKKNQSRYTVEIAMFLDPSAYKIFSPLFNYKEEDLRDMLLAYINGVQALYRHPSLGVDIQFTLVRLTLLRSQPPSLPPYAERSRLLDSFCAYQKDLNVLDDDDPRHWDMALMLSGMDFYSEEGGRRNGVTMGLAPVGGVCLPAHACVVTEFGTSDTLGRPYPSAGFTSVYILAHEIGHNLGMHHDGTGNTCSRDGYIMSPSRGTNGEATWSPCSARIVADLDWASCLSDGEKELEEADMQVALQHEKFNNVPGLVWDAKRQCEVLLRDKEAWSSPSSPSPQHCSQLTCRSPHKSGFYYAGPALPGTKCGDFKWCQGGECVKPTSMSHQMTTTPTSLRPVIPSISLTGWSSCRSSCLTGSKGLKEKERTCSPNCDGRTHDIDFCDDSKVCGKKTRLSSTDYATRKCSEYSSLVPELDARGGGLQAPHDPTRMWMGCALFCRRAGGGGFYAPRVQLNDVGLNAYFPDGTWCHNDGHHNYYCLHHHCLPENFDMTTQWQPREIPEDDLEEIF